MSNNHIFCQRYWSLIAALALPTVEVFSEIVIGHFFYYEIVRTVLFVICIALLIHSWFMQRRYTTSKWRLVFFTLLLSLVALGPLWFGMNGMRAHYYPLNWDDHEVAVWSNICSLQYRIVQFAEVLSIVVVLWLLVDLARWLAKRSFGKLP